MLRPDHRALWRIFIPTWRFFDRVEAPPRLFVERNGRRQPALVRPPRRWFHFIFAPAPNLHHADENMVLRLLQECREADDPAALPSYRMLARRLDPGAGAWRFVIALGDEDVLISPVFAERT